MRRLLIGLVVLLLVPACKKPRSGEPPNLDPYKDVTPSKVKQKLEAIDHKEQRHRDELEERAKEPSEQR